MNVRKTQTCYEFEPFRLDLAEGLLFQQGEELRLSPTLFHLLQILVENSGHIVEKEELMNEVWPERFVEEGNLSRNISSLRKVLGDNPENPRYIETIPRRGYRFLAAVQVVEAGASEKADLLPARRQSAFVLATEEGRGSTNGVRDIVSTDAPPSGVRTGRWIQSLQSAMRRAFRRRILLWAAAVTLAVGVFGTLVLDLPPGWPGTARTGFTKDGELRTSLAADLSSTVRAKPSLAVLPFANVGGDPEEEYFSDGLTDELIATLSGLRELRVVARRSVFAFKGENRDIREIGRVLNVATVLEGSVRKAGDRFRVTAQLINVADGFHLWSDTYERGLTDIFKTQSDLALQITRALQLEILPADRARLVRKPSEKLEAYTLYLKGHYFWHQRGRESLILARDYFERAIEADAYYAPAYAGLALVYFALAGNSLIAPDEGRERMGEAAYKAVHLDEGLAAAHSALGAYLYRFEWDWIGTEKRLLRAIELDPGDRLAHSCYAYYLECMGRFEEAIQTSRKALELDPLAPYANNHLGRVLILAGKADLAEKHLRDAIELYPAFWFAHQELGHLFEATGDLEQAIRAYETAETHADWAPDPKAGRARALALMGKKEEARRILGSLSAEAGKTGLAHPVLATVSVALGETDAALEWLERAYRQRHMNLPHTLVWPGFAGLRHDPRFADLRRRMGLPD